MKLSICIFFLVLGALNQQGLGLREETKIQRNDDAKRKF